VLKAGHCHGGNATAKLDSPQALQDAIGLLSGTIVSENGSYCSLETFIDAKFDVHIQKIGTNYKAFMWVFSFIIFSGSVATTKRNELLFEV
jgi:hypothetical protein